MEQSLQGQLLLASPAMMDPNFARTVILIVQHNDEGAFGLVLNRPMEMTIESAWDQFGEEAECAVSGPLFKGGPCEGMVMVLHGQADECRSRCCRRCFFPPARTRSNGWWRRGTSRSACLSATPGGRAGSLNGRWKKGPGCPLPASAEAVFADPDEMWEGLMAFIARMAKLSFVDPKIIPDDPSLN